MSVCTGARTRARVCVWVCVGVCACWGLKEERKLAGHGFYLYLWALRPALRFYQLLFLSLSLPLSLSCVCVSLALVGWDCLVCRQIASVKNIRRNAEEVVTLGRGVGREEGGPGGHSGEGV